jgi:3-deoxy-manno-octulosonate cytidylyltransferase (CMP-KDO synthetase)
MANVVVIPARLASTRLPKKLLLDETGKPLICHTIDRAKESKADEVIVATEDQEIIDVIEDLDYDVSTVFTPVCNSGTDRVAWVANNWYRPDGATPQFNIIVNLQGDEPELKSECINDLIDACSDPIIDVATIAAPANNLDYRSHSVVKVVLDHEDNAMYFSRCAIPYDADKDSAPLKHIGVYAYRYEFLLALGGMKRTTLGSESLEQLQWLQSGFKIRVLKRDIQAVGVDTRQEYDAFVRRCQLAKR